MTKKQKENKTGWGRKLMYLLHETASKYDNWKYAKHLYHPLHDFIHQLLTDQNRKIVEVVEGMRLCEGKYPDGNYKLGYARFREDLLKAIKNKE